MTDKDITYDFIKELDYPGMKDIDIGDMSTDECQMLRAFVGLNPASHLYGKIIGFFEYKDGRIFQFMFHVHRPNQKYACLSNQMTNINELVIDHTKYGDFVKKIETAFGHMAFWAHTDMDLLKKTSSHGAHLRQLMLNVRDYSRSQKFCQQLRKTDRAHLKWAETH